MQERSREVESQLRQPGDRMLKEQRSTTMDNTGEHRMEDHTVTLNGVDLHYRTIGDGPVLFLVPPGWGVASVYLQRAFQLTGEAP
jgi:hypothetical protein